jgi:hypothetical protein
MLARQEAQRDVEEMNVNTKVVKSQLGHINALSVITVT